MSANKECPGRMELITDSFSLRQHCTDPVPEARVVGVDYTDSNPSPPTAQQPLPSLRLPVSVSGTSQFCRLTASFYSFVGTFRNRPKEKINKQTMKLGVHMWRDSSRSQILETKLLRCASLWLTGLLQKIPTEKQNTMVGREPGLRGFGSSPLHIRVIKAWQEYPNGGLALPEPLVCSVSQKHIKNTFPSVTDL